MTNRKAIRRARRIRRTVLTVCLMALVAVLSIGGTIAWLTSTPDPITNTFTVGDITINLTETTPAANARGNIEIVPGTNIDKNPTVTVTKGSEKCTLFVMFKEANWPTAKNDDDTLKVRYTFNDVGANGWQVLSNTGLTDGSVVYYRVVDVSEADQDATFALLANNKVYVDNTLNEGDMATIAEGAAPSLSFKAFAIQYENLEDAANAWAAIDPDQKNFN